MVIVLLLLPWSREQALFLHGDGTRSGRVNAWTIIVRVGDDDKVAMVAAARTTCIVVAMLSIPAEEVRQTGSCAFL